MFENDTYSYKGWLTSDYFLKRAFGVLLYNMVAALMVYAVIFIVIIVLIAIFIGFAGLAGLL
jgi:hypothetical protein